MLIIDCEQGTPDWYAARLGIPTASEFDSIITPKTGKLAAAHDTYIDRLIDEMVRPNVERGFAGNKHTLRGKELEPEAREFYAFECDVQLRQVGLIVSDDGLMGCSPDSLVDPDGGLEIKCPDGPTHVAWVRAGGLPTEYKAQVHGSLLVTGRAWWDFLSYCPGYAPLLVRTVPDAFTAELAAHMAEFQKRYAKAREMFIPILEAA